VARALRDHLVGVALLMNRANLNYDVDVKASVRTAQSLGLVVPQTLLLRGNETGLTQALQE
jgi:hypothetical protein